MGHIEHIQVSNNTKHTIQALIVIELLKEKQMFAENARLHPVRCYYRDTLTVEGSSTFSLSGCTLRTGQLLIEADFRPALLCHSHTLFISIRVCPCENINLFLFLGSMAYGTTLRNGTTLQNEEEGGKGRVQCQQRLKHKAKILIMKLM